MSLLHQGILSGLRPVGFSHNFWIKISRGGHHWQYTYINKSGERINDDLYYEVSSFERGVAVATTSNSRVLINANGDALLVENVGDIIDYDDRLAICRRSLGGNQFEFIAYELPNGFVIERFTKTFD